MDASVMPVPEFLSAAEALGFPRGAADADRAVAGHGAFVAAIKTGRIVAAKEPRR